MEALTSAQKAAIIISSIGTENASEVFKHFSDEEVEQITLEIARMNYYPMEVVDSVLNEFYELCLTQKVISEGGVEYARDILEKALMFVFEDIVTLDNMAIQAFIPEVDSKDLAVAIKGSTPEVAECIYANMSTRMRESVQTDVEYLHNVRMRDVEEAQQRIVSIIRRLEDEGTLVISKGGKEDEIIA